MINFREKSRIYFIECTDFNNDVENEIKDFIITKYKLLKNTKLEINMKLDNKMLMLFINGRQNSFNLVTCKDSESKECVFSSNIEMINSMEEKTRLNHLTFIDNIIKFIKALT